MKYIKIALLGEGTFGKVFKVRDEYGKFHAMKILIHTNQGCDNDFDDDGNIINFSNFKENYLREFRILPLLNHPNIIKYRGQMINDIQSILITELSGAPLDNFILSKNQVRKVFYQLTSALCYLHDKYIHRDLKPGNILYSNDVIKIIDFGKCIEKGGDNYGWETALYYTAPEVCLGSQNYGPEIDIWSLGCIFYEKYSYKDTLFQSVIQKNDTYKSMLMKQVLTIFKVIGNPTKDEAPTLHILPRSQLISDNFINKNNFLDLNISNIQILNLLKQMLNPEPTQRITAEQLLKHDYFKT